MPSDSEAGSRRDRDYLEHIRDAAAAIRRSTAGGRERFFADEDAFDAGLRRLHTIAESTQRLSTQLKDRHPEVPWTRIAGFRNRIVHAYMDVDPELIWSVIQDEVPALVELAGRELDRSSA
ncbi:MAG: DUF86 domain-containing protein [Chloroflexi bacterium]|nr:MAG: DUF86 domain-containing protein [Chloroflexota bacterium]